MLEQRARFVSIANRGKRFDIPERADEKRVLWSTEVVTDNVAINEIVASQIASDCVHRAYISRVARRNESERVHQQETRIECVAFHRRCECSERGIPCTTANCLVHADCLVTPERCSLAETQVLGDVGETIACRPTHDAR